MRNKLKYSLLFLPFLIVVACTNNNDVPKPRGYLRIDLPEKSWQRYDSLLHYSFDYPAYTEVVRDPLSNSEDEWINIHYPAIKATIHLSYKQVKNNLHIYTEDARSMALKHLPKANAISDSLFFIAHNNVYGAIYQIGGKGVASPIQFYASDSTSHFIRGALYFNFKPNNDSVSPVIGFIKSDILHFLNSLEWSKP